MLALRTLMNLGETLPEFVKMENEKKQEAEGESKSISVPRKNV